jgi:DNA-binding protein YbaB
MVERPDWDSLHSMVTDLTRAVSGLDATQRKMFKVTGIAWSDDRMIKAVVGPRGQLIDLEIDPRIYRKPNSKALSATILATVRKAVDDAVQKTSEILDESVPVDMRIKKVGSFDVRKLIESHDRDLGREDSDDE